MTSLHISDHLFELLCVCLFHENIKKCYLTCWQHILPVISQDKASIDRSINWFFFFFLYKKLNDLLLFYFIQYSVTKIHKQKRAVPLDIALILCVTVYLCIKENFGVVNVMLIIKYAYNQLFKKLWFLIWLAYSIFRICLYHEFMHNKWKKHVITFKNTV